MTILSDLTVVDEAGAALIAEVADTTTGYRRRLDTPWVLLTAPQIRELIHWLSAAMVTVEAANAPGCPECGGTTDEGAGCLATCPECEVLISEGLRWSIP